MEGEENQEDASSLPPPPQKSELLAEEPFSELEEVPSEQQSVGVTDLSQTQTRTPLSEILSPNAVEVQSVEPTTPPPELVTSLLLELPPIQSSTHPSELLSPLLSEKLPHSLELQSSSAEPEGQNDLNVLNFELDKPYKAAPQTEIELSEKSGVKKFSGGSGGGVGITEFATFHCPFTKRSPFTHNPPQPEIRRTRIDHPRTPREYIINLREDLADFQESHGLPRSRDYTFMSLGLALAQETARTVCSLFLMFAELFPILAIVSLILRFALDKLIEILETNEPVPKLKKIIVFAVEMLAILIPLYILIGTIIIPLIALILSIFKRMFRIKGGSCPVKTKPKPTCRATDLCRFLY